MINTAIAKIRTNGPYFIILQQMRIKISLLKMMVNSYVKGKESKS